jgi:hypothetical protein
MLKMDIVLEILIKNAKMAEKKKISRHDREILDGIGNYKGVGRGYFS